jgi:hypothetical protein
MPLSIAIVGLPNGSKHRVQQPVRPSVLAGNDPCFVVLKHHYH